MVEEASFGLVGWWRGNVAVAARRRSTSFWASAADGDL
jgi:hypothetical protein